MLEFRESQEKGLVSFRLGGWGAKDVAGGSGDGPTVPTEGTGLLDGDSAGGDQGIDGRVLVTLFSNIVLLGWFFSEGLVGSVWQLAICKRTAICEW